MPDPFDKVPSKPKRFERFVPRFNGRGPEGRRLCVWCGTEVPKGRIKWCSKACIDQMMIRHWPAVWTREVIRRDKGLCQICGFDSQLLGRVRRHLYDECDQMGAWDKDRYAESDRIRGIEQFVDRHLWSLGFKREQDLIEADHIIPIVEGGANTLANGRTLCVPCHKEQTRLLAERRRWARRARPASIHAPGRIVNA